MATRRKRPTRAGEYIRNNRKSLRISMRSLAQTLGVHWTLVSQWEHGQTLVHISRAESVANALGLLVAQLRAFIADDMDIVARVPRAPQTEKLLIPGPDDNPGARGLYTDGGADDRVEATPDDT